MANLIYSRTANAQEISMDRIQRLAPAVFADDNDPSLSGRYAAVNTLQAIDILRGYGYVPVQAAQKQPRKNERVKYAQHMLAFAHKWNLDDSDRPEVILYNSHDGKSSLKLFAGFFRGICSNGLVAGDGYEGRLRHLNGSKEGFENMFEDVAATIPEMSQRVRMMKDVRLSHDDALEFAYNAMTMRWEMLPSDYEDGSLSGAYADPYTGSSLLAIRRVEDRFMDMWTVYNRVQEAMIRGGARVLSFTERNPYGKRRYSRPIGSVDESIRVNRGLWDLAEKTMMEVA